ncbi:DUF5688 family protein [Anaerosacchariphilus polymeriproducens]|uniref:Uncharacterized protein n=1 Tax=Anaerosacchariphilus polymeriproducens TaxID=1812858 RepID=A0A371B0H1_9FIRM|nr:DUF5688 family protein [Anaerosacchariphilus polymeriproducens]RDU25230.1 hypothetical protein DWV06_00030 [Anaerosacchariphilus polymeriproducens]
MEYKEFIQNLIEDLKEKLGEDVSINLHSVIKNNSVELDGLSIVEKNMNISPTIYINDYFEELKKGRKLESIESEIIKIYEENKIENPIDINFFTEFDLIKERIVFKLINYKMNYKLLQEIPHIQYLDLAIVFYCLVSCNDTGNATILIHNKHMNMWNTDLNELYLISKQNTPRILGYQLRDMDEIMKEILFENLSRENDKEDLQSLFNAVMDTAMNEGCKNTIPMYVLSNKAKINGASCLLYKKVLEEFSNKIQKDFYILPSSVHEVIFVPYNNDYTKSELIEMVQEVNQTQVQKEEILSNTVYFYSKKEKKIMM